MNELITTRIRESRKERGFTQQELATYLGKTAAAISELERGKVHVSAIDLFQIAKFLSKPVEYFYGEEFVGDDVLAMIAVIRRMPSDVRADQIKNIMTTLNMIKNQDVLNNLEDMDLEDARPYIEETYQNLITYLLQITRLRNQAFVVKKQLEELLGLKEEEIPDIG